MSGAVWGLPSAVLQLTRRLQTGVSWPMHKHQGVATTLHLPMPTAPGISAGCNDTCRCCTALPCQDIASVSSLAARTLLLVAEQCRSSAGCASRRRYAHAHSLSLQRRGSSPAPLTLSFRSWIWWLLGTSGTGHSPCASKPAICSLSHAWWHVMPSWQGSHSAQVSDQPCWLGPM